MRMPMMIATAALAGCAAQVSSPPPPDPAFVRELAGRIAGTPQNCVVGNAGEALRPIDPATIAYGSGRTIYVNHLAADCLGLRPFNTLVVESWGGNHCRGDRVRVLEPGSTIPGPVCILGDWVPYRRP